MTTADDRPPHRRGRPRRALLPGAARRGDPPGPGEPPGHVRRLPRADRHRAVVATSTATSTGARSSRCGAASGRWRAARSRSPRSATRSSTRSPTGRSSSSAPPRTRSGPSTTRASTAARSCAPAPGQVKRFRCPYHGFTWNLDGTPARDPVAVGLPARRRGDVLPARGAGRDVGRVRLRQRRPDGRHRSRTTSRTCPWHFAEWPLEERYLTAHVVRVDAVQLEGRARGLHRGVPHDGRAPAAADRPPPTR